MSRATVFDRYKDSSAARRLLERVRELAEDLKNGGEPVKVMEVCGTHTVQLSKTGIRSALEGAVRFVSGPGCPVCVTDQRTIDDMISLARLPGVTVCTFGDMMKVPGTYTSLYEERARGADVRIVYSPMDALQIAREVPQKPVVFLGVGFETTTPAVALALKTALQYEIRNFYLFLAHKLVPPAMRALLEDSDVEVSAYILPGHVSTILGKRAFDFVSLEYGYPSAIAGFEPVDILLALFSILKVMRTGAAPGPGVINCYPRAVTDDGNVRAKALMSECFKPEDAVWRGLGLIPGSGLGLRGEYSRFDAKEYFDFPRSSGDHCGSRTDAPPLSAGCMCGHILKGKITPVECPLFSTACTPETPVGPCMVSGEGACAAYYYDQ